MPEINYGSFKQKVDDKGRWLVNFSAALAAMKRGEKVARSHWGGYWFIDDEAARTYDNGKFQSMNPMIVACLKDDGGYAPAQAYQEDLLAEDWVVIGREEEVPTPDKEDYKEAAEQSLFFGGITGATISADQITGILSTPRDGYTINGKSPHELDAKPAEDNIYALIETLKVLDADREGDLRVIVANRLARALGTVE